MATRAEISKILIQLSRTPKEADEVIQDRYHFETVAEKIAFLKGMFGVQLIGHENDLPNEQTYFSMLCLVINVLDD